MSSGNISIEAQISEIEYQLKAQRRNYKASMRSIVEMHEDRLRKVLGMLRWIEDNKEVIRAVNRQLKTRDNAMLAPLSGIEISEEVLGA